MSSIETRIFLFLTVCLVFKSIQIYPTQESIERINHPHDYLMGVSDNQNFVWFRVAKVGSTSIRKVILKKNKIPFSSYGRDPFNPEAYKTYFKFAFVRNPWARVVSCYVQRVNNENCPKWKDFNGKGFEYFVDYIDKQDLEKADIHLRLQTALIPVEHVDFIGRLENFENDLKYVLNTIGLEKTKIPRKNSTSHQHYSAYYNEKTKEIIGRKYKADIEAFGYEFESKNE